MLHRSSSVGWSRQKLPGTGYKKPELGLAVSVPGPKIPAPSWLFSPPLCGKVIPSMVIWSPSLTPARKLFHLRKQLNLCISVFNTRPQRLPSLYHFWKNKLRTKAKDRKAQ